MQKLILSILFILLFSSLIKAQEVVLIQGRVVDSLQQPLELCNIMAIDTSSGKIASFGVTDESGRFRLKLVSDEIYEIKASHIGFENFSQVFKAQKSNSEFLLEMKVKDKQLDEVEIVYEFPIRVSGDTVIYNADSFNKGDERKLEDVLENLPGFEIDEYGEIKVQGKTIDKVLVEGKPFFDGDSKMATENIPANAVDKVELLRNFTEIGPMSGLNNQDRMALNIRLDKDKKNMVFGDLEAAIGIPEKSLLHSNLFYYNPKTNVNLILDRNDIGRQAFGPRDYFRFGGGMQQLSAQSGQRNVEISNQNGMGFLPNNTAKRMNNSVEAFNFNYSPKKMRISGLLIASQSRNNLFTENQRTYLKQDEDNMELLKSDQKQKNLNLLGKIGFAYEPSNDLYFAYELFGKNSESEEDLLQESLFLSDSNIIQTQSNESPYTINQKLDFYYSLGKKDLVSFQAETKNDYQNPSLVLNSENGFFENILGDSSTLNQQLFQLLEMRNNTYHVQTNYYRILNRTSHINLSAGYAYDDQYLNSSIAINGDKDQAYSNDSRLSFSNPYLGLNFKKKIGKFTLNPGINSHFFKIRDNQINVVLKEQVNYLPYFFSKFEISSSQDINFRYSMENNFYNIRSLVINPIINSYNSISIGNRQLENAIFHNFNLNYFNFNLFSSFNISGGLNYQYRTQDLSDSLSLNGIERSSQTINMDRANTYSMAYGHMEKTFNDFKLGGKVELSNTSFSNYLESSLNVNKSFSQLYGIDFESTFFKKLTITLGYDKALNSYTGSNINSTLTEDRPFARVYLKVHKNMFLRSNYRYNNYRNIDGTSKTEYQFLDAELSYQKAKKPWTFSIKANNIADTRTIRNDEFSDNLVNISSYYVLPRFMLFSVKYDI